MPLPALPWYGIGGVPAGGQEDVQEVADDGVEEAVDTLQLLSMADPGANLGEPSHANPAPLHGSNLVFTFTTGSKEEHESAASNVTLIASVPSTAPAS